MVLRLYFCRSYRLDDVPGSTEQDEAANLDIVRGVIAAFDAGDLDAVFALAATNARFENRSGALGVEGTYVGRDGLVEMLSRLYEVFSDYEVEPLELYAHADRVAVLYREVGLGRTSGVAVDRKIVLVYTLKGGVVQDTEAFPYRHGSLREALVQGYRAS